MNRTTTEQKLQLIQQIRSRYRENRHDMYNREQILYGRSSYPPDDSVFPEDGGEITEPEVPFSGFRLRLFLAALLFVALVVMDVNKLQIAGITSDRIMEVISVDYESRLEQWMETFSGGAAEKENSQSVPQR